MEFKQVIIPETSKKIIEKVIVKPNHNESLDIHAAVSEKSYIKLDIINSEFGNIICSKSFYVEKGINNIISDIKGIVPSACIIVVSVKWQKERSDMIITAHNN
ncbi:MAG TPA: hypothetical protein DEH02_01440 [Bacteroidales bacterium]|nr:hypothetical protein [Bacteroidales bacterium]